MRLIALSVFISLFLPLSRLLSAQMTEMQCKDFINQEIKNIPGWCSPKKAEAMMDLIFKTKPDVCVELGVFAGASLLPTAMALKHLNHGIVYAVDAWNEEKAIQYYEEDSPHRIWWGNQDMALHYNFFVTLIKKHKLNYHCIILKEQFESALSKIDHIDILHIDASHTNKGDFIDVKPYTSKIKKGGYIWFDGWATSPDLYEYLKSAYEIKKVVTAGQCILLQKVTED